MHDQATVAATVRRLFDGPVGLGITDPISPQPALLPGEDALLGRAMPARRVEFAAGRATARMAMADAGLPLQPVLAGQDRAPQWPAGMVGSIAHSKELCLAVVSAHLSAVGIDIELLNPIGEDLVTTICTAEEIAHFPQGDPTVWALVAFAAKEAAYKAQYPLTQTLFGFDALHIALHPATRTFTTSFTQAVGPFAVGDRLPGRFAEVAGHLVTAVSIGHFGAEGA